jgi:hypothetical protein
MRGFFCAALYHADIKEEKGGCRMASYTGLKRLGGGLLALMGAEEAEAGPVYSKDGRRLLDLLDKAAKGELTPDEPPMEYPATLPNGLLKSYQADDPRFVSESLGSSEGDIFHYWNDHNRHMTNEQIEEAMHAILYADERFHTKGNPPWTEGLGAIRDGKGYNASLYPGEQFTGIYQLNPINEKRLLKKLKSLEMGTPDESAGHPIVARPEGRDVRSERVSADGVRNEVTIPASSNSRKAIIPLTVGGVLMPATAEAYQFPADKRGTVRYEAGLESPSVDPVDVLLAPVGAVGAGAKAAAMAAEPFISYGMDKVMGGLLSMFGDEEE